MAEYAKVTCRSCKVRLPAPKMSNVLIHPLNVKGAPLASRWAPLCPGCYAVHKRNEEWQRTREERLAAQAARKARTQNGNEKAPRKGLSAPHRRKQQVGQQPDKTSLLWSIGFILGAIFKRRS